MEAISKLTDRDIPVVLPATVQAFLPLLHAHLSDIDSIRRETFQYGSTERHKLDVYYPTTTWRTGGKAPVLFFAYGGGFTSGNRIQPPPVDIMYRNLGAFFARRGIFTVIADYRLVPHAKFPDGSEDVKDAIAWTVANADEVAKNSDIKLDIDNLFPLGHSAGASHTISTWFIPNLLPADLRSRIKGYITNGAPFTFRPELLPPGSAVPTEVLEQYYGPGEEVFNKEPSGLLKSASQEVVESLPPLLLSRAENEPFAIEQMNIQFAKALKERLPGKNSIQEYIMKGHNHISPSMSLSSGEGEEWGDHAVEWIKSKVV